MLEVNHSPSFSTDSPLDEKVKGELIRDAVRLLCLTKRRKKMYVRNQMALQNHRMMNGKFLRLPPEDKEKYRQEFEVIRDAYEMQNLGSYEKIYPCADPEKMKHYQELLKYQREVFENNNGYKSAKKRHIMVSSASKSPTTKRVEIKKS